MSHERIGNTPSIPSTDIINKNDTEASKEETGVDHQGREIKRLDVSRQPLDTDTKPAETDLRDRAISTDRFRGFRDNKTTRKTRTAVDNAITQLQQQETVKDIATTLDNLTAVQREALSQKEETPVHCRKMLNRRVIADKLSKSIAKYPEGLFRKNTSISQLNAALNVMDTSAIPDDLVNNPLSCGNLFKKAMSKDKTLTISSFKSVMATKKGITKVDTAALKTKLASLTEKITPDQKDAISINLSVIKNAFYFAPATDESEGKQLVTKDDLLDIFTDSLFIFPPVKKTSIEKMNAQINSQKEAGRALLKAILEITTDNAGLGPRS